MTHLRIQTGDTVLARDCDTFHGLRNNGHLVSVQVDDDKPMPAIDIWTVK